MNLGQGLIGWILYSVLNKKSENYVQNLIECTFKSDLFLNLKIFGENQSKFESYQNVKAQKKRPPFWMVFF